MGIDFDDQKVDVSGVNDRRGGGGLGGPVAIGGGGIGVVGLIIYVLISVLGGGGGGGGGLPQLVPQDGSVQGSGSGRERPGDPVQPEGRHRPVRRLLPGQGLQRDQRGVDRRVRPRRRDLRAAGADVLHPGGEHRLRPGVVRRSGRSTARRTSSIYIDIGFLDQLQQQFGAEGRYAQAYILAHEAGHHLQTLFGTERKVRSAQQADPGKQNELSIALELQADCYAGVWSKLADDAGNVSVGDAEVQQAQDAAAAVGDDRIQQQTQGRVDKESWTHGSAAQRKQWFTTGRTTGDVNACDTFKGI